MTQDGGHSWTQYGANTIQLGSMSVTQGAVYAISTVRTPFTSSGEAIVRLSVDGSVQQIWPAPVPTMGIDSVGGGLLYGFGLPTSPTALLQSTDSGRTWQVTGQLPGTNPNVVTFVSPSVGYAVSSTYAPSVTLPVQIFETSDGGRNWTAVGSSLGQPPTYLHFFAGGVGVRVDYEVVGGIILHTTDGGRTWTLGGSLPYASVSALSFSSPEDGFAYSGTNTSAKLYATTDGGRKWTAILTPPSSSTPSEAGTVMDFPTSTTGLVQLYAQGGQYVLTGDGGRSWSRIDLESLGPAIGAAVVDSQSVLLLTTSGLYRTRDGGKVWSYVP